MRFSPTWRKCSQRWLFIFSLLVSAWRVSAQVAPFGIDSIPVVNGKIVFQAEFVTDMDQATVRNRVSLYLNDVLKPHTGTVYVNNDNHIRCRITDYINISASLLQSVGMYMTYDLSLQYKNGGWTMLIWDILYVEKQYYEAQEVSKRKLDIPQYSAEDIILGNQYKLILIKNASKRIAESSIERINGIVRDLDVLFSEKG
ncbi:hypothetical protein [Parapedobacter sp. 10938]|uniref:hypothetical protein n=1 Tax=Parapedobacter flavus TaxID=3110225 RepID=UPI002DB6895A|nr:hypothetical protein [Parapedobacter sp. 10938]MEC3878307.1 hypothetical protein [Parapedobacter sp. 10938]